MGKMEDFVLLLARWVLGVSGVIFLKLSIDTSFKDSFVIKVGNGNNTLFWRDPWCSTGLCLVDIFPRPFALDTYKDCKVCDRWGAVNGVWGGMWSWRVPPMGRSLDDITTLSILIGDFRLLESENDYMIGEYHVWNSWIPKKVNICTWRASLNRLPTRSNLAIRGVAIPSSNCPLCNEEVESLEHLNGCSGTNKALNGVLHFTIWSIWKWRNKVSHADSDSVSKVIDEDIFPAIQRMSKTWISARLKSSEANWNIWISRPFDIFS
ncbi:RNA-directed DNA polymerase, eukaryota, reverse transcriptase zinc-binding domain protein [Tanacetum coccineum]